MDKRSTDAIEQYATGQVLFENKAHVITHIAPANESAVNLRDVGNVEHPLGQTKQPRTLADLVAHHVPVHQQAEVLALIYNKQNNSKEVSEETKPIHDQSNELG